jgi:hypothetical protein
MLFEYLHAPLKQRSVARSYTDSHNSLQGRAALEPYQRFTVDLGDFVVHHDLVALEADSETLLAIETKGSGYRDAFAGLTQAELYRVAFRRTYLAADAGSIPERRKAIARLKNVRLLAVADSVQVLHEPDARLPLGEAHCVIVSQLERSLPHCVDTRSVSRCGDDPPLYGWTWDVRMGAGPTTCYRHRHRRA